MPNATARRDIVAIAASAGGVEAIGKLLHELPADLPAAVLIVLHRSPEHVSQLAHVLQRATKLRVSHPKDGEILKEGVCYVPDEVRHLTVGPAGRVRLLPDGFYRARNIDALFSSLAVNAGPRTVGVLLTGMLSDGAFGLRLIKDAGGAALVQSPLEARHPEMPAAAIQHDGSIDLVGPIEALARKICELVRPEHAALGATPPAS